jgi:hypothetical protein
LLVPLLLAAAAAAEFPYRHGLVCERPEAGRGAQLRGRTCTDPVGGAVVVVKDDRGHATRVTTDARGEFVFASDLPMDGRRYSMAVEALGYDALVIEEMGSGGPVRPINTVQVIFSLPRPASVPDDLPVLYCGHGVRYLLHSGESDNLCRMRGTAKECLSASRPDALAQADCAVGCAVTGGPGICCRMGSDGCEPRRLPG